MLAKAESVEQLDALAAGAAPLLPLIETARGLAAVAAIAAHPRTARLLFGALDLQLDLDIEDEDEGLLLFRSQLVLASRLAGLPPPLDGVTATLRPEALSRDARRARRLGFGGKLCIHPVQVAAVNAAFLSSEAQLAWARRVCAAAERAGGGATTLDGVMVDLPVLRRAERVLAAPARSKRGPVVFPNLELEEHGRGNSMAKHGAGAGLSAGAGRRGVSDSALRRLRPARVLSARELPALRRPGTGLGAAQRRRHRVFQFGGAPQAGAGRRSEHRADRPGRGVRLMSRVDGLAPERVRIGMAVRARIVDEQGQPLLVFVPAGAAA